MFVSEECYCVWTHADGQCAIREWRENCLAICALVFDVERERWNWILECMALVSL